MEVVESHHESLQLGSRSGQGAKVEDPMANPKNIASSGAPHRGDRRREDQAAQHIEGAMERDPARAHHLLGRTELVEEYAVENMDQRKEP